MDMAEGNDGIAQLLDGFPVLNFRRGLAIEGWREIPFSKAAISCKIAKTKIRNANS
jgi:hypothetical protein